MAPCHLRVYGLDALQVKVTGPGSDWWGQQEQTDILTAYTHHDRLGSIVNLTDKYGRNIARADYREYGEIAFYESITVSGGYRRIAPQLVYTNHEWDDVVDLYYAKARFYDADDKRFLSMDPVKGRITDPQSLTPYVYCVDNPLKYTDPLGMVSYPELNAIGHLLSVGFPNEFAFAMIMLGTNNYWLAGHQLAQAFMYKALKERGFNRIILEETMPDSADRADVIARQGRRVEIFELKHRRKPYTPNFTPAKHVQQDAMQQLRGYYEQVKCYAKRIGADVYFAYHTHTWQYKYELFKSNKLGLSWYINLRHIPGGYVEYWFSSETNRKKPLRQPALEIWPEDVADDYREVRLLKAQQMELNQLLGDMGTAFYVTAAATVGGVIAGVSIYIAAPSVASLVGAAVSRVSTAVTITAVTTGEVVYQIGTKLNGLIEAPAIPSLKQFLLP